MKGGKVKEVREREGGGKRQRDEGERGRKVKIKDMGREGRR